MAGSGMAPDALSTAAVRQHRESAIARKKKAYVFFFKAGLLNSITYALLSIWISPAKQSAEVHYIAGRRLILLLWMDYDQAMTGMGFFGSPYALM